MAERVYGTRRVGDQTMDVSDEFGDGAQGRAMLFVGFEACDAFRIPEPGHPTLPRPGTEITVTERGWGLCSCCRAYQPHLRGSGVGVIECKVRGQFHFYVVTPEATALVSAPGTNRS